MKSTRAIAVLAGLTLGITTVPILIAGTAAAADPCHLPGGVLELDQLQGRSAVACGVVGRLVDTGSNVPLPIPPAGSGVILGMLHPTGERTYTLTTDLQGRVTTTAQELTSGAGQGLGRPTKTVDFPDVPGPGSCERDSYVLAGFKWHRPWLFRTTIGTTLATGRQADFDAAARRATDNFLRGRNPCGLRGGTGAAGAFVGHTAAHGNFLDVGDETICTTPDSENVLDTGDTPGGFLEATLATYCVWTETDNGVTRAVSADLRFNDVDYSWTYNPNDPSCDPAFPADQQRWRYDVESVITHEVGHVFGLVNLSADEDVNLTMYPGVRRCTGHFRDLGLGDLLGMRALYSRTRH